MWSPQTNQCSYLLSMREHVRLKVCGLCKTLVTAVERTHIRSITGVDSNVSAKIEIKREPFTASLESALQKKLSSNHKQA